MAAKETSPTPSQRDAISRSWTFFSNHTHVLVCLYDDEDMTLREVAERVGITERAVQKMVAELEVAGIVTRIKKGRRNSYTVDTKANLRHPIESHRTVGDLLELVLSGR
ncbi:helix-turn-helix transcriptional regulator [Pelagicoccus albus]|uniref:Winged helix-turn-helix transcriptional regulator n=1 Tax=Pelagicoccus albus TaxID=415222 RepID=A0A7X1B7U6_9BACT|nr:winged helix-turn-helix domain-containing protein [Pelagicoccus albus]MBC2607257.1 winged helix-turn-helix transcriptional regulator [Pelagicoccus albus]